MYERHDVETSWRYNDINATLYKRHVPANAWR